MAGVLEMFCGVLVFGGVAAAYVSAREAHAKLDPAVARLEAFFASVRTRLHFPDLVHMRAFCSHIYPVY